MSKRFAILLASYNGEKYFKEQLESLAKQTVEKLDIWISDDGSTDSTVNIAQTFGKRWEKGRFNIAGRFRDPKRAGIEQFIPSNENFRSLILNRDIEADYYAFCDQDDIWDCDKLDTAREWIDKQAGGEPALYFSRTRLIDRDGNLVGTSHQFSKPPAFKNAIVQNISAGNTIVMNRSAMELVRKFTPGQEFVSHDWWCYLVITGCGGKVCFSSDAKVQYRQHTTNLIGQNKTLGARLVRLQSVFSGRYQQWNSCNLASLKANMSLLTTEAQQTLIDFENLRNARFLKSCLLLRQSGIYRQRSLEQLALYLACGIGRM